MADREQGERGNMGTTGDGECAQNLVNNCLRGTRHFLSVNWPDLVLAS